MTVLSAESLPTADTLCLLFSPFVSLKVLVYLKKTMKIISSGNGTILNTGVHGYFFIQLVWADLFNQVRSTSYESLVVNRDLVL